MDCPFDTGSPSILTLKAQISQMTEANDAEWAPKASASVSTLVAPTGFTASFASNNDGGVSATMDVVSGFSGGTLWTGQHVYYNPYAGAYTSAVITACPSGNCAATTGNFTVEPDITNGGTLASAKTFGGMCSQSQGEMGTASIGQCTLYCAQTSGYDSTNCGPTPYVPPDGFIAWSHNSTQTEIRQATSPFATGTPTAPLGAADFLPANGSYIANGNGVNVPILRDYYGNPMTPGNYPIGALNYGSTPN